MATRNPTTGMAHLTVVPENFEAADDATSPGGAEVVEADSEGVDAPRGPSEDAGASGDWE